MLNIYLAGAIRDQQLKADVEWREQVIDMIDANYPNEVRILNPLGNKTFNPETREWRVGGIITNSKGIVQQDLWSVRNADIVVANFSSMVSGYPSIGTVMEVGAAAVHGNKLIYTIIDPTFSGHGNPGAFKGLHPFLEQLSTEVFSSAEQATTFLRIHLGMLTGQSPRFGGKTDGSAL